MVFGQLVVQCNSQLAAETTKQSNQEIKVQLTVVHEIKRASRALCTCQTNEIRYSPFIIEDFLQKGPQSKT